MNFLSKGISIILLIPILLLLTACAEQQASTSSSSPTAEVLSSATAPSSAEVAAATVTAGSNVVYEWDFGDGQAGSGASPIISSVGDDCALLPSTVTGKTPACAAPT